MEGEMSKLESEIRNMTNEELIDAFEGNVDNQSHETWKYLRVTKNTKKRYEVIRAELMRRMGE